MADRILDLGPYAKCDLCRESLETGRVAKYGYYSAQSAANFGTALYSRPDGTHVEVTEVGCHPDGLHNTNWEDIICVGPVTALIHPREGNSPLASFWKKGKEASPEK